MNMVSGYSCQSVALTRGINLARYRNVGLRRATNMCSTEGVKNSVLFVCLGNICRSPTAEAVFRHVVENRGLQDRFEIDSCGTGGGARGEFRICFSIFFYRIDDPRKECHGIQITETQVA